MIDLSKIVLAFLLSCLTILIMPSLSDKGVRSFYFWCADYADGFLPENSTEDKQLEMVTFVGKIVLLVNVASLCGYADDEYKELVRLHDTYAPSGVFEVLAFPCNQFGDSEPWEERRIVEHVRNKYGVKFRIMQKVDVYGPKIHMLWEYMQVGTGITPTWNFFKHIIDTESNFLGSFPATTNYTYVERAVRDGVNKTLKGKLDEYLQKRFSRGDQIKVEL